MLQRATAALPLLCAGVASAFIAPGRAPSIAAVAPRSQRAQCSIAVFGASGGTGSEAVMQVAISCGPRDGPAA